MHRRVVDPVGCAPRPTASTHLAGPCGKAAYVHFPSHFHVLRRTLNEPRGDGDGPGLPRSMPRPPASRLRRAALVTDATLLRRVPPAAPQNLAQEPGSLSSFLAHENGHGLGVRLTCGWEQPSIREMRGHALNLGVTLEGQSRLCSHFCHLEINAEKQPLVQFS